MLELLLEHEFHIDEFRREFIGFRQQNIDVLHGEVEVLRADVLLIVQNGDELLDFARHPDDEFRERRPLIFEDLHELAVAVDEPGEKSIGEILHENNVQFFELRLFQRTFHQGQLNGDEQIARKDEAFAVRDRPASRQYSPSFRNVAEFLQCLNVVIVMLE